MSKLASRLTEIVKFHDQPNLNTRQLLTDHALWRDMAAAIEDTIYDRLQEIIAEEIEQEEKGEEEYKAAVEELPKPRRRRSRG